MHIRSVREHNERMVLAWHIAALQRQKKMTPIKKLMAKVSQTRAQTWQEQQAVMDQWVVYTQRRARQQRATKVNKRGR